MTITLRAVLWSLQEQDKWNTSRLDGIGAKNPFHEYVHHSYVETLIQMWHSAPQAPTRCQMWRLSSTRPPMERASLRTA